MTLQERPVSHRKSFPPKTTSWNDGNIVTNLSRSNDNLKFTLGGADNLAKLLADALEDAEAVVLGQGGEQVVDGLVGGAGLLLEFGDDGGLVLSAQGRRGEDGGELGILGDDSVQLRDSLGGRVEGRGLNSRGVLFQRTRNAQVSLPFISVSSPKMRSDRGKPGR